MTGRVLIEPGVWRHGDGGIYVERATWAAWDRAREATNARYDARRRHERAKPVVPHRGELLAQLHVLRNHNDDLCERVDHLKHLLDIAIHHIGSTPMAATNINRIVLTGNLTADPELRVLPSGIAVCKLRVASNSRRKGAGGEWEDKPNYFDVTVWGGQGENTAKYLVKGKPVAIDGRLEWREWESENGKRQAVEIVADSVQFLGGRDDPRDAQSSDIPNNVPAAAPAPADDDIPF